MTAIPVHSKSGRVVGTITEDVYNTKRKQKKHFFFKFEGYGISLDILKALNNMGVNTVRIEEETSVGTTRFYTSKLESWFKHSDIYEWNGDEQRILPMAAMTKEVAVA
jgi:hypothetical protein